MRNIKKYFIEIIVGVIIGSIMLFITSLYENKPKPIINNYNIIFYMKKDSVIKDSCFSLK